MQSSITSKRAIKLQIENRKGAPGNGYILTVVFRELACYNENIEKRTNILTKYHNMVFFNKRTVKGVCR